MDLGFDGAIHTFQKKIGTYDKANWEIIVEKQSIPQIDKTSSDAKLPTDLLDVDLLRGSSFTKSKPGYHWTQVTTSGLLKIILFPIYYSWWKSQITQWVWMFMSLYFLQLFGLVIYFVYQADESLVDITWPEAFVPIMALILVGELYIHVVSSNFTKPMAHKIKKTNKKRSHDTKRPGRGKDRKKSSKNVTIKRNADTISDEGIDSYDGRRPNDTSPERHSSRAESVERKLESDDENSILCKASHPERCLQGASNSLGYEVRKRIVTSKSIDSNEDIETHQPTESVEKITSPPTKSSQRSSPNKRQNFNQSTSISATADESSSSDESTDSSGSSSTLSENEEQMTEMVELFRSPLSLNNATPSDNKLVHAVPSAMTRPGSSDKITVSIWSGNSFKKLKLTFYEIGLEVVNQVEIRMNHTGSDYVKFSLMSAFLIGMLPMLFRVYKSQVGKHADITCTKAASELYRQVQTWDGMVSIFLQLVGPTIQAKVVIVIAVIGRIASSFCLFFMLCVAEGTYKKRYMYAKFFSALTSTRRARRNQVPHFRLHKVKNIKAWLSLRSFLKKRGPQRSVDTIVSAAFILGILLLVICCVQFLSISDQKDHFLTYFFSWEVSVWGLVLGVFLIRFIALGSDINRKYRNSSILLTEQINLYLQMEKNPEKKEELLIANNVLKLASDLLKELDGSFKISGFIMNPLLSNITRVVVLSLFSGVMSDILGFRLRLWKIKA